MGLRSAALRGLWGHNKADYHQMIDWTHTPARSVQCGHLFDQSLSFKRVFTSSLKSEPPRTKSEHPGGEGQSIDFNTKKQHELSCVYHSSDETSHSARSTQRQRSRQSAGEETKQRDHGEQQDAGQDAAQNHMKSHIRHGATLRRPEQLVSNRLRFTISSFLHLPRLHAELLLKP
ncbi:hypothetical protein F2P81_013288 [Scophthalmus maximus]|uniref:Uncharacterized protein n=1 Tax=Scophthalmus maximus TaxID=52904 RepID=A0A6A4SUG7_SCOMX|nr:hypothetical protein F2P81_013288 [Scophthalmus maximus]